MTRLSRNALYARRLILLLYAAQNWRQFLSWGDLPAYSSFSAVVDPDAPAAMMEERRHRHEELHEKAANVALELGVHAQGAILPGKEVRSILRFLEEQKADLLVVGLHQHDFHLARLWSSMYDLAQEATCSMLGVH
jgi:nucleotide-binding universal stress UspA family protein